MGDEKLIEFRGPKISIRKALVTDPENRVSLNYDCYFLNALPAKLGEKVCNVLFN